MTRLEALCASVVTELACESDAGLTDRERDVFFEVIARRVREFTINAVFARERSAPYMDAGKYLDEVAPAPTPAVPATPEGPDDPAHWHLCRHDILKRDCAECREPLAAVPATTPECPECRHRPHAPGKCGRMLDLEDFEAPCRCHAGAAVPATTPVCAAWCGQHWDLHNHDDNSIPYQDEPKRVRDTRCFCSPGCRDLGHPRNPPPTQTPEVKP